MKDDNTDNQDVKDETENKKETVEVEIDKYIAEKEKEETIKTYIKGRLDRKRGLDYWELKSLYDYMCGK